ncbi:MAG: ABC transporter permease [Actinobacteria bacterium]|nr:ABC transporter permease [Actinomycetota bacterium]
MNTEAKAVPRASLLSRLKVDRFSALYLWAGFMIVFGIWKTDTFISSATFKLTLGENVPIGILALAFLVPLATNSFDLSIGAMCSLSLVVSTFLQNDAERSFNLPGGVTALVAVLVCSCVGFVSGFVVVKLRVNSFIATLGISQLVTAVVLKVSDNRQITSAYSPTYLQWGRREVLGLPILFIYLMIIAVILWFVLEHTPVGRYLFATGGNGDAARLAGVRTDKMVWGSLVASATLAGIAGILLSAKIGFFSSATGPGFLFPAIAAVFFGASQLSRRPNVWGTVLALYALAFGIKGLQLVVGAGSFWVEPLFQGTTLIIAVALASQQGVARIRRKRAA